MKVLLYVREESADRMRLEETVFRVVPPDMLETYSSVVSLSRRLQEILAEPSIVVLFASTRDDLLSIASAQDLLRTFHILLVTPDQQEETVAIAHQLHPRFLTDRESSFDELSAVLTKKIRLGITKTARRQRQ
jgi:hypothetical protein